jgi:hypothetical protein
LEVLSLRQKIISQYEKGETIPMNNIKYTVVEGFASAETNFAITYGIAAYDLSSDRVIARIDDITCDKARLEHLVELCNRGELSLVHLYDVVEDFLCC